MRKYNLEKELLETLSTFNEFEIKLIMNNINIVIEEYKNIKKNGQ
ncbi:hypothetical protein [Clostridium perfringens]|nr:hypothetical protein [Clostridium perfringens]MDK0734782.1 hypothetical protein [Clostridium perfringens]MEA5269395.1 hypothetical protein [Clostridium perfringens]MEA5309302.1 hypothetical protein [Clostridium perfringens]MEA5339875.1 hypothetical protein [Clostridium perfringens]